MNEQSNPELRANERLCPECGKAVNLAATTCVHCGAPLTPMTAGGPGQPVRSGTGLDPKVAGALTYVFTFVTGIIFLLIEKDDDYVRFHAGQAVAFGVAVVAAWIALTIASIILDLIPWIGPILITLAEIVTLVGALVLWIVLMVKAYQGERFQLPFLGELGQKVTASVNR